MGGQVVDTQSAEEFMRETLENVSRDELISVAALLDTKSAGFSSLLGSPGRARTLSRADLRRVLRAVFATPRQAAAIPPGGRAPQFGGAVAHLLPRPRGRPPRLRALYPAAAHVSHPPIDPPAEPP